MFECFKVNGDLIWFEVIYILIVDVNNWVSLIFKIVCDVIDRMEEIMLFKVVNDFFDKLIVVIEFILIGEVCKVNCNFFSVMGYLLDQIKGKYYVMFCIQEFLEVNKDFWKWLGSGEY